MLTYSEDNRSPGRRRFTLWRILVVALPVVFLLLLFTQEHLIHLVETRYPTAALLVWWAVGMLSYHQDAKLRLTEWAIISQIFAGISLIALVVFGFTHGLWINFLIAPPLIWLHFQFSQRWWARPGAWW
jgi:hypothetical protein